MQSGGGEDGAGKLQDLLFRAREMRLSTVNLLYWGQRERGIVL